MKIFRGVRGTKGFTLVELAIVLVIIGVILGAVLQGRSMINSARVKRVVSQQKEISAAIYTFQDKFGQLPGDWNQIPVPIVAPWIGAATGNGNGQVNGTLANATATCAVGSVLEGCVMWDHLRRGEFISGVGVTSPTNPFGGIVGIGTFNAGNPVQQNRTWIVFTAIPGDLAQMIDTQYDDGAQLTGSIIGSAAYTTGTNVNIYWRL